MNALFAKGISVMKLLFTIIADKQVVTPGVNDASGCLFPLLQRMYIFENPMPIISVRPVLNYRTLRTMKNSKTTE